jgi:hypothetical protein
MDKIIEIPRNIEDTFGDAFAKLFKIIKEINNSPKGDKIVLDFSKNTWVNPFFILPLMLISKSIEQEIVCINTSPYLDNIYFNNVLKLEDITSAKTELTKFTTKSYIPIVCFTALKSEDVLRDNILEILGRIIKTQLNPGIQFYTAIRYIIDEAVANIKDHSGSEKGFIFAQYYASKQYIDICISDCGKGILQSYLDNGINNISNSSEALAEAINGLSTKNLPSAENRGYGIRTSRKMIVTGLGGYFSILSGDAFYVYNRTKENIITLKDNLMWKGTIVAIRMPYSNIRNFDYSKYLE